MAVATVKTSTGTLSRTSTSEGSVKAGIMETMTFMSTSARPVPTAPPMEASTTLSARNCVAM